MRQAARDRRRGARARDARGQARHDGVRARGEFLHEFRRHGADVLVPADRRGRGERLRAALPRERRAARRRRSRADRRRLRVRLYASDVTRTWPSTAVQRAAARALRRRARGAVRRRSRRRRRRRPLERPARRCGRARSREGLSSSACSRAACRTLDQVRGAYKPVLHAQDGALARAWTCTTSATTKSQRPVARCSSRAWCMTVEPGIYVARRREASTSAGAASASASRTTCS